MVEEAGQGYHRGRRILHAQERVTHLCFLSVWKFTSPCKLSSYHAPISKTNKHTFPCANLFVGSFIDPDWGQDMILLLWRVETFGRGSRRQRDLRYSMCVCVCPSLSERQSPREHSIISGVVGRAWDEGTRLLTAKEAKLLQV